MPIVSPRQALNKAFLKLKPLREDVAGFSESVKEYVRRVEASFSESEEYHKNLSREHFLQQVVRGPKGERYDINTSGRADLVIRGGSTARSDVKVLLEYKSPSNDGEMPRANRLDCKATRELLLYYLRERETAGNLSLTQLIVTNGLEWYIWDAQSWERAFHDDKELLRRFREFEAGTLSDTRTQTFYKEIASPLLSQKLDALDVAYIDLWELLKLVQSLDSQDLRLSKTSSLDRPTNSPDLRSLKASSLDRPTNSPKGRTRSSDEARTRPLAREGGRLPSELVAAYKLFSDTHLLKMPFANDSNSLNKEFYNELLYIMGLEQYEVKNKKLIGRAQAGRRHPASLLEATISQLESEGLTRVANKQSFGGDQATQTYEVALALVITWINRVLFCKLLEGQLLGYHESDRDYAFRSPDTIGSYDALADLWF